MSSVPFPYRDRAERVRRAKKTVSSGGVSAPTATTLPASSITGTAAALNASVSAGNQATSVYFDYGTTDGYGTTVGPVVLAASSSPVPVQIAVISLTAGTTYHFRARAVNASGASSGADAAFGTVNPVGAVPATTTSYGPAILVTPSLLAQASPGTITIAADGTPSARITDIEYIGDVVIASGAAGTRRTPTGAADAIAGLRVTTGQIILRDLALAAQLRNFEVIACPAGKAALRLENVGGGGGVDHARLMNCSGDGLYLTDASGNRCGATTTPWSTATPDLVIGHLTVHASLTNTTGTGVIVDGARNAKLQAIDFGTDPAYNGTGVFPAGALKIDGKTSEADCEDVVVTSVNPGADGTFPGDVAVNPTELPSLIDAVTGATRVQVLKAKRCGWRRSLHSNTLGSRPEKPCSLGGTTNATCVPTALVCDSNYAALLVNYTFTSGQKQLQRFPVDASLWGVSTLLTDWSAAAYAAKQVDGRKPLGATPTTVLSVAQSQVFTPGDGVLVQANDGVYELVDKVIDATNAAFTGAKTTTDASKGAALTISMIGGVTVYRPGDTSDGNGGAGVVITLTGAVPSSWDPTAGASFKNASLAFMPTTLDTAVAPTLTSQAGIARLITYKTVSGSTLTGCQLVDFTGTQVASTSPLKNRSLSLHLSNSESLTAASNGNFGRAAGNAKLQVTGTVRFVRCKQVDAYMTLTTVATRWIRRDCEISSSAIVDTGWRYDSIVGGTGGCYDPCSSLNDQSTILGQNVIVPTGGIIDWDRINDHGHHGDWCDGLVDPASINRNSTILGGVSAGPPSGNSCTPHIFSATHADQMQTNRGRILPWDNVGCIAPAHTILFSTPSQNGGPAGWVQVTAATRTNPIQVTLADQPNSSAHHPATGDRFRIRGCDLAAANGEWVVTLVSAKVYKLNGSTGVGAPADGTVGLVSANEITAIATGATTTITFVDAISNLIPGVDVVEISGVGGLTGAINGTFVILSSPASNQVVVNVTTSGAWDGNGILQYLAKLTGFMNCCDLSGEGYAQPLNPASGVINQGGITIQCQFNNIVDVAGNHILPPGSSFKLDVNDCRINPGDPGSNPGGAGSWLYPGASGTATPSGANGDEGARARNFWTVGGFYPNIGAGTTITPGDAAYPQVGN